MRILSVSLFIACLTAYAGSKAQTVTISGKDITLKEVFTAIKKQTGYVVFTNKGGFDGTKSVSLSVVNLPIKELLDIVLKNQPLEYTIQGKTIILSGKPAVAPKTPLKPAFPDQQTGPPVKGVVKGFDGKPLTDASVRLKGSNLGVFTDASGEFIIDINPGQVLIISYTGYEEKEIIVETSTYLSVRLSLADSNMQEVIVNKGYYSTSKKFNTGSVGKVSADIIERQPVPNPLQAISGRIPGVFAVESNGNPGAPVNIQIRGLNSISQGSSPLFIVDGIPYPNSSLGFASTVQSPQLANRSSSPLSSLNPSDIQSIEVLKDADATAIYGSRGANGVVLITTKRGKSGKPHLNLDFYSGIGKVNRKIDLLTTPEYKAMRREALANDGVTPTFVNSPDLLAWDTTRYTDWQKVLIGNTAQFTKAEASFSGGTEQTQFLASGNYYRQTSVYPGAFADSKAGIHTNLNHYSLNKRLQFSLSTTFNYDKNQLPAGDVTSRIFTLPNLPATEDADGKLRWMDNGVRFTNPLAFTRKPAENLTKSVILNLRLQYELFKNLYFNTNVGYSSIITESYSLSPMASQDPYSSTAPAGVSQFAHNSFNSFIIEPNVSYKNEWNNIHLEILAGTSYQEDNTQRKFINASGFSNDDLLFATVFAGNVDVISNISNYRYNAGFGRVNVQFKNRYLLNFTGRRDGSSRFGPGRQFANFGAVGTGWIFSEEPFFKQLRSVLSYGKLRGSYGVTGNDQIGDYQFLDNYIATSNPYNKQPGLRPARLFNSDYGWERNKKFEIGLELGLLQDKLMVEASYYKNRSNSQLINYLLPDQTGFSSILKNFEALVDNSGFEFVVSYRNKKSSNIYWQSSFNISMPKNKLLSFPGFETSSYYYRYYIGQSIGIVRLLEVNGVDPLTGQFIMPATRVPNDQTSAHNLDPKFFGGFNNEISFKNFELSAFISFHIQDGYNYIATATAQVPGSRNNMPRWYYENRWQKPGDQAKYQRLTTTGTTSTLFRTYALSSAGRISDASFARLKNVSLAYNVPGYYLEKIKLSGLRLYVQGQNLFTITRYKGIDPETNGSSPVINLPPLTIFVAGIKASF